VKKSWPLLKYYPDSLLGTNCSYHHTPYLGRRIEKKEFIEFPFLNLCNSEFTEKEGKELKHFPSSGKAKIRTKFDG
jgi:hypothetical protein